MIGEACAEESNTATKPFSRAKRSSTSIIFRPMRSTTSLCASFTSCCISFCLRSSCVASRWPCAWARAFCSSFQVFWLAAICWRRSLICLLSASSSFWRGANCDCSSADACFPSEVETIACRTFRTPIFPAPAGAGAPWAVTAAVPSRHNMAVIATRIMFLEFTVFSLFNYGTAWSPAAVAGEIGKPSLPNLTVNRSNLLPLCTLRDLARQALNLILRRYTVLATAAQSEQYIRLRNRPANHETFRFWVTVSPRPTFLLRSPGRRNCPQWGFLTYRTSVLIYFVTSSYFGIARKTT